MQDKETPYSKIRAILNICALARWNNEQLKRIINECNAGDSEELKDKNLKRAISQVELYIKDAADSIARIKKLTNQ